MSFITLQPKLVNFSNDQSLQLSIKTSCASTGIFKKKGLILNCFLVHNTQYFVLKSLLMERERFDIL